jgi:hypothetical protein
MAGRRTSIVVWAVMVVTGALAMEPAAVPHSAATPARAAASTWTDLPAATQDGILTAVRRARRVDGPETLAFTNPEQQVRVALAPDHVRVVVTPGAAVRLGEPALGRPEAVVPLVAEGVTGEGTARVERTRRAGAVRVTEWWSNAPAGIEQGFVVATRPAGRGALTVRQALETLLAATVTEPADAVVFADASGERLRFTGLRAWDATGRTLLAGFAVAEGALEMRVDDAGAVYPVTIDPTWTQQAYLKAFNTGGGDRFGASVAVSGDTVVVGAPEEDSGATGVNGDGTNNTASQAGAAYVFVRSGTTWTQQAYLKGYNLDVGGYAFGSAVAVSGDTVVVGAPTEQSSPDFDPFKRLGGAGAAYVFVRSGTTWTQQAFLTASNRGGGDFFGSAVAVSGDTVVVGAPGEDSAATGVNGNQADNTAQQAGAAYVFVRGGTTWTQQAYLKASNAGADDRFGESVAVSSDTVVVGAPQEDSAATGVNGDETSNSAPEAGAAYVFARSGTTWTPQAYVKASNAGGNDAFGSSVGVSGDTAVVGAKIEASGATGVNGDQASNTDYAAGAAYVFVRSGATWIQQAYLKASNTELFDGFGWSVAVSGDTVVVGACCEASAATGGNGNQADNSASMAGAAYVFARSGTTWTPQAYLKASNTGADDRFGTAVAVSGDTVVVGACNEDSNATGVNGDGSDNSVSDAGAAYVGMVRTFFVSPTTWSAPATGGTQAVMVTASHPDGDWTATSNQGWLTASPLSGTGSDTVTLTAAANPSAVTNRSATATIAGQSVTVTQAAGTATFAVSRTSWDAPAVGGAQAVTVTASHTDGAWAASSDAGWLTVSAASGTGSGSVTLTAAANPSAVTNRSATATIAGQSVAVTQAAGTATFAVSRTSWDAPAVGGAQAVTVTASHTDGAWAASSDAGWLTVSAASGTGSGSVTLTAAPMPSGDLAARTATATIAGQTVTVSQAPAPDRPLALRVVSVIGNTVTLRWLWAGPPPDSYVLQGGVVPGQTLGTLPTGGNAPIFSFEAPTGAFYVRMRGVRGGAHLAASDDVRVFVNVPQVPSAPGSLLGLANGAGLDLTWAHTAEGGVPTGVELDVTGPVTGTVALPLTERFTFSAVPDGTFTFRVRATNAQGSSPSSNAVTLTFPGTCEAPGVPQGFQVYAVGQMVFIWWDPPASGAAATAYLLKVWSPSPLDVPLAARGISGSVPPGSYTFTVAAQNTCGTGTSTSAQTVLVP